MELPDPDIADSLVDFVNQETRLAKSWHEISAVLKGREAALHDLQAGWLMAASNYGLTRRAGERKDKR